MPSAYEGTDIISCLQSKYIIRLCRISHRAGDISLKSVLFYGIIHLYPKTGSPSGSIRKEKKMSFLFTETANCSVNNAIHSNFLKALPDVILKHTDWDYSYRETDTGCLLTPTFRHMPHRNSFVPEIDVVASNCAEHTILQMCGRPVRFARILMAIWFISLSILELCLLFLAITAKLDHIFPVFIPIGMCTFGYLLCKLATKATFNSVIEAIRREYT